MKKLTRWIIVGLIALLVAGMIIWPNVRKRREAKESGKALTTVSTSVPRSRALNVNAEVVKYTPMTDSYVGLGSVIPFEEADLTFEASGKVTDIFFREGEFVGKGMLLAKINDAPLQAQLKKLESQTKLYQDRVYRQQQLLERDAVSQETYETAVTEYNKLMADIDLVKANIAQTELRAPFDGRLGLRSVSEGAFVSPSTPITTLSMTNMLKLDFTVPESYSTEIGPGTRVKFFTTDSRGILREYYATVYALESSVDRDTRTLRVRADFRNDLDRVVPGNYVSIELLREEIQDAISVPSEAIIPEMGRNMVYVVKNGKAQPVDIEAGIRTASRVQAISGLHVGDTLITSGVMQLRSGMDVILNTVN